MNANANHVYGYGWAAFGRDGSIYHWNGVHETRKDCIANALLGCMGAVDYGRLGNDSDRWKMCYREGCRVRKVAICEYVP